MAHRFTFFIDPENITGESVRFSPSESRHIASVLRFTEGDQVTATDGKGRIYTIELGRHDGDVLNGRILHSVIDEERTPLAVAIALPCLKGERWQTALEACCEMGVDTIRPVDYEKAVSKWTKNRLGKARRKAVEILKQCGGSHLTEIAEPTKLPELLNRQQFPQIWVADSSGGELSSVVNGALLVVGPEAEFSAGERDALDQAGVRWFNLGKRRLRSEIAVIAALSQAAKKLDM